MIRSLDPAKLLLSILLLTLTCFSWSAIGSARAAEAEFQTVIDYARETGARVIVVSPDVDEPSAATHPSSGLMERFSGALGTFERNLVALMSHMSTLPQTLHATVVNASTKAAAGTGILLAVLTLMMGLGYLCERRYHRWLRARIADAWPEPPADDSSRMALVMVRFLGRSAGIVLFCIVSAVLAVMIFGTDGYTEHTIAAVIGGVGMARLLIELWRMWLSPAVPEFRLAALADSEAKALFTWIAVGALLIAGAGALYGWLEQLGLEQDALALVALVSATVVLAYFLITILVNRDRVSRAIGGAEPKEGSGARVGRLLVANWHLVLGTYMVAAWITTVVRLVMGIPNAVAPSGGMIVVLLVALILYGAGTVVLHSAFKRRGASAQETGPDGYELLARRALVLLVGAIAVGAMLWVWGVDLFDRQSLLVRLWDVIFVAVVGYVVFQLAQTYIEQKMAVQAGLDEEDGDAKGSLSGVSRISTLLPLFRSFILGAIVVLTVMIGLSELGVDIAPLFAGAGIIGLAVGFGAQTLVKDIISGAFFLADDAFRQGEFVDIGDAQGTVEQINIRSMKIRHADGLLQTVPFGGIGFVTNWSRDWALMKLKLRVPYDTDVERVRKLIKRLGLDLLEDPDIGPLFLQPLKSQGVLSMEDSAMIIRVKFMTRPGDQYEVRQVVYARIRELFEREGIQFANRQVTVRLADGQSAGGLDEDARAKIAGAALPAAETETAAPQPAKAEM